MVTITRPSERPMCLDDVEYITVKDGDGHYLTLPSLTTTERNALTPDNGMMIYNSTTLQVEAYQNGAWGAVGAGDVTGPASSTDNAIARFDGTGGKTLQDTSQVTISDTGVITSSVATGTAPLSIASTTVVANFNADMLDGKDETSFLLTDGTRALTGNWDAGSFKITAQQLESDVATGTAPLIVASTTAVTNLNADKVDGKDETAFLLADGTRALAGAWSAGGYDISNLGAVGIGTASPSVKLHVVNENTNNPRGIISSQHNTGAHGAQIIVRKSRETAAAPTAVVDTDYIGTIIPEAYDGSNYQQTGFFGFRVRGTVASGSVPTEFALYTGSSNQGSQRLMVTADGNVGIDTSDQFGGGVKVIGLVNAITVPTTTPTGGGVLYATGGALHWLGSSGTDTTIAPA